MAHAGDVDRYPATKLVVYDVEWPRRFRDLAAHLVEALGEGWVFEHVGSTSVPGLAAKPVIDVAMRCPVGRSIEATGDLLSSAGWTRPIPVGDHMAMFLLDDQGVRTGIGHLFTADQWPTAHVRLFADWLRRHPDDRHRYQDLKNGLVGQGHWGEEYTQAKAVFVHEIVNRARAEKGLGPITTLVRPG